MKRTIIFLCSVAVICSIFGVVLTRYVADDTNDSSRLANINDNLEKVLSRFTESANDFKERVGRGEQLPRKTEFPFFVVRSGVITEWTDHHIAPPIPSVLEPGVFRFIRTPAGEFLFNRIVVSDQVDLIGGIKLYQHYKVRNQYLQPRFNREIFGPHEYELFEPSGSGGSAVIINGSELFRVEHDLRPGETSHSTLRTIAGTAYLLSLLAVVILILRVAYEIGKRYPMASFIGLLAILFLLRATMMLTGFPTDFIDSPIFDPKNFASSELNPSLGDMLISSICVLILCIFLLRNFARSSVIKSSMKNPTVGVITFIVAAVCVFFGVLFPFVVIQTIYNNSQISLSITRTLNFDLLRFVMFAVVMISSVAAFIFVHVFVRILTQSTNWKRFIFALVVGILIFGLINERSGQSYYSTLILTLVFLLVVLALKLNKTLTRFRYSTFIYLVSAILMLALNCTYAIERHESKEQVLHQSRFASNVLVDRDYFGEFLLSETLDKIKKDAFTAGRMVSPLLGKDAVKQKIRQYQLPGYFNKYNVDVQLYSSSGGPLDNQSSGDFATIVNRYSSEANKTDYSGVYFIGNLIDNVAKQYIAFTPVNRGPVVVGYVVLELSLKRVIPESVYPELLVDTRFQQVSPPRNLSYAVFLSRQVHLSSGDYNYDVFNKELFSQSELYSEGIEDNGYIHTATEDAGGKIAVVSTPVQPVFFLLADFSFLVILGLMVVFAVLLFLGISYVYAQKSLYLSARIQLIINLAFFIPLIGVSVVTLGLTANASQEQINSDFLAKSKSFAAQISSTLSRPDNPSLESSFNELARLAGLDANVFSPNGELLVTSQPQIFENQLLGGLLNPQALAKVRRGDKNFVLEEFVGTLNYYVAYSAVYSPGSGALSGIVALPFFQSASSLERMQISVLANILIIFMVLFVVLLVISAFVSRWLTYPLTMITQKLGKISLVSTNQPLNWKSEDEIGIMVREYNQMIEKLSENKIELERTQREQAWREIAQQVAHEIKNPLTPMKLTLQQLERLLGKDKQEKVVRSLSSLLTQVDTLDGIANSFSTFAKMPEPVLSNVELVRLTENIVELHQDSGAKFQSEEKEAMVIADKQLIGRIFSNIILNGLQSSVDSTPEMLVTLIRLNGYYRVIFEDKGDGIAPELRDKIFLPHFTTKQAGSGLGLAIAKQGIEQMGGRIWFDTEVGMGTTFYVELPALEVTRS